MNHNDKTNQDPQAPTTPEILEGAKPVTPTPAVADVPGSTPVAEPTTPTVLSETELVEFRQRLQDMSKSFLSTLDKPRTQQTQPVTSPPVQPTIGTSQGDQLAFEGFNDEIDVRKLNTVLGQVISRLNTIKPTTVPDNLVSKPELENVTDNLAGELYMLKLLIANPDFIPYADYVKVKARMIAQAEPNINWADLTTKLVQSCRKELRLEADATSGSTMRTPQRPSAKTTSTGKTKLQEELDSLDF